MMNQPNVLDSSAFMTQPGQTAIEFMANCTNIPDEVFGQSVSCPPRWPNMTKSSLLQGVIFHLPDGRVKQIAYLWTTGNALFLRFTDKTQATLNKNGEVTAFKPKKPLLVLSRNPRLSVLKKLAGAHSMAAKYLPAPRPKRRKK